MPISQKNTKMSRFFLFYVALVGSNNIVVNGELRCGTFWTKPCLGDTDIRYDPDYSNNLKDQAKIWDRLDGYFLYEQYFYSDDMNPYYFGTVGPNDALTVRYFPTIGFYNHTIKGTRAYNHRYLIFPGLQDFAPSVATAQDSWETSSYEKDGRSISRGGLLGFSTEATLLFDVAQSTNYVVDDRTIFGSGYTRGGVFTKEDVFMAESHVCLDDECEYMATSQDQFESYNGVSNRTVTSVMNLRKVSEQEWIDAIHHAMDSYNVLPGYRVEIPMTGECLTQVCNSILTEEWWCETDPNCSESPYVEPDPALNTGVVVGIAVAGLIILLAVFFVVHRLLLQRQEKRNRVVFVKRIADTVKVGTSLNALSPEELAAEFALIESQQTDSKGCITKEKLKAFLNSGKAGEIKSSDFEALFNAIDLDGNGTVNFVEFCAFLAHCEEELNKVNYSASSADDRRKAFLSEQSARKLSLMGSPRDSNQKFDFGSDQSETIASSNNNNASSA